MQRVVEDGGMSDTGFGAGAGMGGGAGMGSDRGAASGNSSPDSMSGVSGDGGSASNMGGGMTGVLHELPVSDISYDLITALQSKLEALTVYETFVEDCRDAGDQRCLRIFEEIWRDDERHAQTLAAELERVIQEGNLHGRRAA